MKENKQMTEQELDQVTGGAAWMKLGDIKGSFTSSRLGIIHPNFTFRPSRNNLAKRNYRLIPDPTVV